MVIITQLDYEANTNTRWGTFGSEAEAKPFIQYLMDSIGKIESLNNFYLVDLSNREITKLLEVAEKFQIHKRNFEERMKGV